MKQPYFGSVPEGPAALDDPVVDSSHSRMLSVPLDGVVNRSRELSRLSLFSKDRVLTVVFVVFAISVFNPPVTVWSQWSNDPTVNTRVAVDINPQSTSVACSDGAGGAIITWQDLRTPAAQEDIWAQRVDADGNRLWTPDPPEDQTPRDKENRTNRLFQER